MGGISDKLAHFSQVMDTGSGHILLKLGAKLHLKCPCFVEILHSGSFNTETEDGAIAICAQDCNGGRNRRICFFVSIVIS